ncbi:hypothetical protein SAY86_031344 [Trapa natans]|uniref:F-box domain-containing protein n=1 Tax=Trapa natans TaxID=22666 RepID=A0AAN7LR15_TRANT|nr:hypothetical protein SAY86_031344 [Trapa natans]
MALNFSHRPIFPSNGCVLEAGMEDMFCNSFLSDGDVKDYFDYGRDRCRNGGCSQDSISNDILDLLPSDPFGMEITSTFTAFTGFLEGWDMDYSGYSCDMVGRNGGDSELFAGLNFLWNNAMIFQSFPGSIGFGCASDSANRACGYDEAKEAASPSRKIFSGGMIEHCGRPLTEDVKAKSAYLGFESPRQVGEFGSAICPGASPHDKGIDSLLCPMDFDSSSVLCGLSVTNEKGNASCPVEFQPLRGHDGCSVENDGNFGTVRPQVSTSPVISIGTCSEKGMPHAALSFVLTSLGVQDLLSVERVCRSLHETVQSDPLLWRNLHISQPLNEKITDDALLQLAKRAQGQLQCLSLIECSRITDDGLKQVLQSNPRISKLCVPGCTRLTINGIIEILRMCTSMGTLRLKKLRIGGLYGVTVEHFLELKYLLGMDGDGPLKIYKPHFYNKRNLYISCDDDRAIDIEMCPMCQKMRLVYDCPAEVCRGKEHDDAQVCRACTLCIARCVQCGRCINDEEYEETFCLEVLCLDCSLEQRLKYQRVLVEVGDSVGFVSRNVPQDGVSHSG